MAPPNPLPIDAALPALVAALRECGAAVVRAPTGAGKTTRVPPALLDAGLAGRGRIVLLEPRRVAARAAAHRMAAERGERVGEAIGYRVRFDTRESARTRILVVTEGLFLRMVQRDPFLDGIAAVLFDEFHERNLDGDLALAMTRAVRDEVRPELKIAALSATLDPGPLSAFLGGCPALECPGRLFPVTIGYRPRHRAEALERSLDAAVREALSKSPGDILVFLPGSGEIRRATRCLGGLAGRRDLALCELHGELRPADQDAALRPWDRRKIILATNVAETSVTIEGVTAVIDTGLARVLRFDPTLGLDRLQLERISRASADQRSGRAGRTAPGLCLRLWAESEQRALPAHSEAEIRRVDLAPAVLQLRAWGEGDPRSFGWFEAPRAEALDRAEELLRMLGAIAARELTPMGRSMARLPLHPRLARLLLEGARLGIPERAALMAALLAERDPFERRERAEHRSDSDLLDRVHAIEAPHSPSPLGPPRRGALQAVCRARDQLLHLAGEHRSEPQVAQRPDCDERALRCLLRTYPERVARRRERGSSRGVMVGGRGVRLHAASAVRDGELFLCVRLDAGSGESWVHLASLVDREWLPVDRLHSAVDLEWDPDRERVRAVHRTRYEDLVLDEAPTSPQDRAAAEDILVTAAAAAPERALALERREVASFLARVAFLREHLPEAGLPLWDTDQLRSLLPELCRGCLSFAQLRAAPLIDHLRGALSAEHFRLLEREAPERLPVPSGSRIQLRYESGRAPVLAVRIQELFGLSDTPRVARGRVKVLLHLLAPSMRPQQITDDLRSFWRDGYAVVRKELRRRYPRHAWPEDPASALPSRKPR